jgi:hypothetical protein
MISRNKKTLRPLVLLQFRHFTRYLRLVHSYLLWLIPRRRLESILKRTEEAFFICES